MTTSPPRPTPSDPARSRPPSVDKLARTLADTGLPHPLCVDIAREAIAADDVASARQRAEAFVRSLLTPVVNATGVLLHTNLGRAPVEYAQPARAQTVEFDLDTGERGSRQRAVGQLFARLTGAEAALVVNNNAAAVLLVLAALAAGREVPVSRGESVEIGGAFRVPEVMEQSGARLVDVGTTNRTRLADYERALARSGSDVALVLKVHPSNFRVEGFVEETTIAELATLDVPVVADIGSGLLDATCPWLAEGRRGAPPAWLGGEPAARQAIEAGAALITFSGDKLLGGPQAGIIAGRGDLVAACARHPLARALRPGGLVLGALQQLALAYLGGTAARDVPFWSMVATPIAALRTRAESIASAVTARCVAAGADAIRTSGADAICTVVDTEALPGAGSAPGVTMPSVGVSVAGDHLAALRSASPPVIARRRNDRTVLDLRAVAAGDDDHVIGSLVAAMTASAHADA